MENLRVYKLTPIKEFEENSKWEASSYKSEIHVVAKNQDDARFQASLATTVVLRTHQGGPSLENPWTNTNLVSCIELNKHNYNIGVRNIVYPKHLNKQNKSKKITYGC